MFKTCVKLVEDLLTRCDLLSTEFVQNQDVTQVGMDKSRVISILSQITSQGYTQLKSAILPLFEQVFYPVSTTSIIMKKR